MKKILIARQVLDMDDAREFEAVKKMLGKYGIKATYMALDVDE